MANYIQYINMGFVVIEDIQEVTEWDVDYAVCEALEKNKSQKDCFIIGFRFLERKRNIKTSKWCVLFRWKSILESSRRYGSVSILRRKKNNSSNVPCYKN